MTIECGRLAVVAAARSWLGTPYHHAADLKGHGVDCAMILVRVFADLGLIENFDPRPYTKDWFLHRDEELYMGQLLARARAVMDPEPGDVMLFKIGRCFAHGAIVTTADPLTVVHAFAPARCVVEDEIRRCPDLAEKPRRFFSYWPSSLPRCNSLENRELAGGAGGKNYPCRLGATQPSSAALGAPPYPATGRGEGRP